MTRSAELQREKYHGLKNGTWDVAARREARLAQTCKNGHPYVEGSFVWKVSKGWRYRQCIACKNANQRARYSVHRLDPAYRLARILCHNPNQRARQMGDPNMLTPEDIEWVWSTYGKACLCCGFTEDMTIDHVIPVSRKGLNVRSNLQPLCRSCNSSKYTDDTDFRRVAA